MDAVEAAQAPGYGAPKKPAWPPVEKEADVWHLPRDRQAGRQGSQGNPGNGS